MEEKKYITTSAEQTRTIGKELAGFLEGGDSVALYGDLGSGKTTLAQGIAQGLRIVSKVTSPTFLILKSYELPSSGKVKRLYHIDAYRLENEKEIEGMGFSEVFQDSSGIVLCEWPEKISSMEFDPRVVVRCEYVDENKRSISITDKKSHK